MLTAMNATHTRTIPRVTAPAGAPEAMGAAAVARWVWQRVLLPVTSCIPMSAMEEAVVGQVADHLAWTQNNAIEQEA